LALAAAVAEARQQELQELTDQLELFAAGPANGHVTVVNGHRGPGRPLGARNKRTDEAARFYMARHGDPLARGVEISALPILANDCKVLLELSKILGMTKPDAAKWWLGVYTATMPYTHQRLSTMTVRPEGAPDGEPVSWTFSDDEIIGVITTQRSAEEDER
jgi:hypothetical protein